MVTAHFPHSQQLCSQYSNHRTNTFTAAADDANSLTIDQLDVGIKLLKDCRINTRHILRLTH